MNERQRLSIHYSPFRIHHFLSDSFDYAARRSAFDEGERKHAPACGFNLFAPVNFIRFVISAFDEDIGQNFCDERAWADVVIAHNRAPAFVQTVLEQGWIDEATLGATHEALRAWGEHPDAYQATIMCEAIGWVDAIRKTDR